MTNHIVVKRGTNAFLCLCLSHGFDPSQNPVTAQTGTVSVRRASDDKWWNFTAGEWDVVADYASLGSEHLQALTDKLDGTLSVYWNQATADGSAARDYVMVYKVTSAGDFYLQMVEEVWTFQ